MVGGIILNEKGEPMDNSGNKLSESKYQPPKEIMQLFAKVQKDYQIAYTLQHRSWKEFDGQSLLVRSRLDQETFGAYVGAEIDPVHKRWRWKGRKNTSRNKIIGILSHILAGMLYPYVDAKNEENEEDKITAKVMRILVQEHLRKADYEMKFLFMALSALVNPAVIVEAEYIQATQTIKEKLATGEIKITKAVDELMSGLNLNIIPIDEFLIGDFYTGNLQRQPYVIRVRRIPWDMARKLYGDNKNFEYVQAGMTRIFIAGQENQTLYDIIWTEADKNYVQEITAYYKDEDLQITWVGGVFMGEENDPYNSNPFVHRRMVLMGKEWHSIPVYPFAKTGFEPLDPTGRFFYYKSAAYKEYWDDKALNAMHRLVLDGTYLDVFKPMFLSGTGKIDDIIIAPGATVGMPQGAQATMFGLGPNLAAAFNALNKQESDISESTQDKINTGIQTPGVTATQTAIATQQAKIFLGVFGRMISELIKQVGELTMDCVVMYATQGDIDISTPESLSGKFKTFLVKDKEKGKDLTNRVVFTDKFMGRSMSDKQIKDYQWKLYDKTGGIESDQRIYEVNPFKFARTTYSMWIDVDQIIDNSMGSTQQKKVMA